MALFRTRVLAVWLATAAALPVALAAPPSLIPQPTKVQNLPGHFDLTPGTPVRVSPGFEAPAKQLVEMLSPATGWRLTIGTRNAKDRPTGGIVFEKEASTGGLGPEGYRLDVAAGQVTIHAETAAGAFYACQTIRQLLPLEIENATPVSGAGWSIPCVRIEDRPRFAWRGMMLDSARHFQDKAFVLRTIDLLARYKLNRLHWHLIDDQGWRVEIPKYPKLTEVGGWRPNRSAFENYRPGKTDERYGGFHSRADLDEIVTYAAARHVTIVPEVEMPGHCLAMLVSYPELSCTGGPFELGRRWIYRDVCCAGNEHTYRFLDDVLGEIAARFPSPWIHVGGDECPKDRWKACPKCQARIRDEKLKDEHQLQSYFVRRVEGILRSKGRRLIGWDEILEGGLAPGATVQSWRSMAGGVAAAKAGQDAVMSPTSHCYLDYSHQTTSTRQSYGFEPIPAELQPAQTRHILGIEGCLWLGNVSRRFLERTGRVMGAEGIDVQAFPRLIALAEVGWSPKAVRDWQSFRERLQREAPRLDRLGVHYFRDPVVWP